MLSEEGIIQVLEVGAPSTADAVTNEVAYRPRDGKSAVEDDRVEVEFF